MKTSEDVNALRHMRQGVLEQYKRHEITAIKAVKQLDAIDSRLQAARRGRKYADSDE